MCVCRWPCGGPPTPASLHAEPATSCFIPEPFGFDPSRHSVALGRHHQDSLLGSDRLIGARMPFHKGLGECAPAQRSTAPGSFPPHVRQAACGWTAEHFVSALAAAQVQVQNTRMLSPCMPLLWYRKACVFSCPHTEGATYLQFLASVQPITLFDKATSTFSKMVHQNGHAPPAPGQKHTHPPASAGTACGAALRLRCQRLGLHTACRPAMGGRDVDWGWGSAWGYVFQHKFVNLSKVRAVHTHR